MASVYIIHNTITNMVYVGSTINPVKNRIGHHFRKLKKSIHGNPILQASYNFYGKECFEVDILEFDIPNEEVLDTEEFWISYLKYVGVKLFNVYHPTKTRAGIPVTENAKVKLSIFNKGKKLSQEHKNKISAANKGNKSNKDRPWSKESRVKRKNINAKKYSGVISPDGIVYAEIYNLSKFCRELELDRRAIRWLISGRYKHWRGWTKYEK